MKKHVKETIPPKKHLIVQGAFLLSVAGFFVKILSAIYRVPFQNIVGNTGFYIYQQVYPIYGIGMTFALTGLPVFLSNLIAEQSQTNRLHSLLRRSSLLILGIALISFFMLWGFAETVAQWMGDKELEEVIRAVSYMFLTMPILVGFRGYFQGHFYMTPTAVSQVIEQIIRVGGILCIAYYYTSHPEMSLYTVGALAMYCSSLAALFAVMSLFYFYLTKRHTFLNSMPTHANSSRYSWKILLNRFVTEGITLCLLSSLLVGFQLIDSFTVLKNLVDATIPFEVAKELKGIYDRGQPLVQLGLVVGVGLVSSYMPLLTQIYFQGKFKEWRRSAISLLRMTMTFSLLAVVGMWAILPRLNHLLFGDTKGLVPLAVFVTSIWLVSMLLTYHGILQSMGQYRMTILAFLVGLSVKYSANHLFIKDLSTTGASFSTLLGLLSMVLIVYWESQYEIKYALRKQRFLQTIMISALLVFASVTVVDYFISGIFPIEASRLINGVIVLVEVALGIALFIYIAFRRQLFTIREWLMMPKGKTLLKWIQHLDKGENIHEIR